MKEVTAEEKKQFLNFWGAQRKAIEGKVSEQTMTWFAAYTAHNNIGYDISELRPGKDGQWDLYHWLTDHEINCNKGEALIASGLTAAEVAAEERREYYRDNYVDPDNKVEVAMFDHIQTLNPDELNVHIRDLEKQLGASV